MLRLPYRPWEAARRYCLRSFSTNRPVSVDQLDRILSGLEGDPSSSEPNDTVSKYPPTGPPGLLPPGGAPSQHPSGQMRSKHELPSTNPDRIYHLHVFTSRNNTILTFTNAVGNTRFWVSAGSCGFKKVQRSGYEAGYRCAVNIFDMIANERRKQPGMMKIEILLNGYGNGREAFYRALMTTEGDKIRDAVSRLTDSTPLKIGGGTRAKKARRL